MRNHVILAAVAGAGLLFAFQTQAADEKLAEKVIKNNDCTKCHTVAREKDGPPYRKIAEKYKGKPDSEKTLFAHLTSEPTVKVDGKEEKHKKIAADSDAEVVNLVQWILSR